MFFLLTEPSERGNWQRVILFPTSNSGGRPVTKATKGDKHICLDCETRFFDFGKHPIACPKCATVVETAKPKKHAKTKAPVEAKIEAATAPVEGKPEAKDNADDPIDVDVDLGEDANTDDDDEDDDNLMEDASDLSDVDDDMSDVIVRAEGSDS